jgi:hypothetical protein
MVYRSIPVWLGITSLLFIAPIAAYPSASLIGREVPPLRAEFLALGRRELVFQSLATRLVRPDFGQAGISGPFPGFPARNP